MSELADSKQTAARYLHPPGRVAVAVSTPGRARLFRLAGALLLAVLMLAGCTDPSGPGAEPTSTPSAEPTTLPTPPPETDTCGPLTDDTIAGQRPAYAQGELTRWPGDWAACGGVWLAAAQHWLVPQGLAVVGDGTAWVSGYDGSKPLGRRACRLVHVNLTTGEELARLPRVQLPGTPYCRHGGGLTIDASGLWLIETTRLWLIDPAQVGTTDSAVQRMWNMLPPISGGFSAATDTELGVGDFRVNRPGEIHWFDRAALVASPLATISPAQAVRTTVAPRMTQGADVGPGGVWTASSDLTCGLLRGPGGAWRTIVPGAEDLEFTRDSLWVISETGSRKFQKKGKSRIIPQLVRYDRALVKDFTKPQCKV